MKLTIYSALLTIFCYTLTYAQEKNTEFKGANEYDMKNYKGDPRDRLIFAINFTSWNKIPDNIQQDWKSIGFNFSTMFDKPLGHSNFSIGYGAGIYVHNFSSNANFVYQLDSLNNTTHTILIPRTDSYIANRYNERSVEIPLELRFRTKTDHVFKVMVGGKIGYVISNFRKTDDADGRNRRYNLQNINKLRYGINFRIGVEQFCLTASYYLSEVFTKNGPQGIHPFSIGLAIIPY